MANEVRWHPEQFLTALDRHIHSRLISAVRFYERELQRLFREQPSGRIYRRGGVEHQASAPGEPPSNDRGALRRSVAHSITKVGAMEWEATVGSNLKYALWLELGTSRMEPRPAWIPAFMTLQAHISEIMKGTRLEWSDAESTWSAATE